MNINKHNLKTVNNILSIRKKLQLASASHNINECTKLSEMISDLVMHCLLERKK